MKIIDTDHAIGIMKGQVNPHHHVTFHDKLCITVINVGELLYGAYRSQQPDQNLARVNVLLQQYVIMPYNEQSVRIFSQLKVELERSGNRLDDADLQIASIALHHSAVLITHNQKHFQRVPGLQLADWMK